MALDLISVSRLDGSSISLPGDLTKAVLIRTPIEGLRCCKFVSRTWGSWLSTLEFHRLYNSQKTPISQLVLPASDEDKRCKTLLSLPSSIQTHPPVQLKKLPFYAFNMFLVASYMGLLCMSDPPRQILGRSIVWNPLTGEGKIIQFPPNILKSVSFGLGFDGVQFNLVKLSAKTPYYAFHRNHKSTLLEIFAVNDNVWKEKEIMIPFHPLEEKSCFILAGIPYWEGFKSFDTPILLWYDTKTDLHGEIQYPVINKEVGSVNPKMLIINNRIVALITDKSQRCIKSYNLESDESWSKGFTIGPNEFLCEVVVGAQYNGGVILCWNLYGGTELFDVANNVSHPVPYVERFSPVWSQTLTYEETLIGVDSGAMLLTEENLKYRVTNGSRKSKCPSLKNIYKDLLCRRDAIIKALTTDLNYFRSCLNAEVADHCLYGFTDGHWEVKVPDDQFGLGFPHPKPVTYLDRHLKDDNNWLAHVSLQSESWLYSIARYYIAELGLDAEERDKLWSMLLVLPPIDEVTGFAIQPSEEDEEIDFA